MEGKHQVRQVYILLDYILEYWKHYHLYDRSLLRFLNNDDANKEAQTHFQPLLTAINNVLETNFDWEPDRPTKAEKELVHRQLASSLFLNTGDTAKITFDQPLITSSDSRTVMGMLFWELVRLCHRHYNHHKKDATRKFKDFLELLQNVAAVFNICICGQKARAYLQALPDLEPSMILESSAEELIYSLHEYTKSDDVQGNFRNRFFGYHWDHIFNNANNWTPIGPDTSFWKGMIQLYNIHISKEDAIIMYEQIWKDGYGDILPCFQNLLRSRMYIRTDMKDIKVNPWNQPPVVWLTFLIMCTLLNQKFWTPEQVLWLHRYLNLSRTELAAQFPLYNHFAKYFLLLLKPSARLEMFLPAINAMITMTSRGRGTMVDLLEAVMY